MTTGEPTAAPKAPEQNTDASTVISADAALADGKAGGILPGDATDTAQEAAVFGACPDEAHPSDEADFFQMNAAANAADAEEAELERALDAAMTQADADAPDDGGLDLAGDFSYRERGGIDIKKLLIPLLALIVVGFAAWALLRGGGTEGHLVISEVVTSNQNVLTDAALGTPDFVELYNGGNADVNVAGYGLSDSMKQCYRYRLPDVTIPAGGYLLIYFAGGTEEADSSPYCTGFGLSKDGETVVLVDAHYGLLSQVDVPALDPDAAYALREDGTYGITYTPTPGSANIVPDAK